MRFLKADMDSNEQCQRRDMDSSDQCRAVNQDVDKDENEDHAANFTKRVSNFLLFSFSKNAPIVLLLYPSLLKNNITLFLH